MTTAALVTAAASIIGAVVLATIALAGLIVTATGRLDTRLTALDTRLTAVEKETARLSGLLEGLGLTGRAQPVSPGAAD